MIGLAIVLVALAGIYQFGVWAFDKITGSTFGEDPAPTSLDVGDLAPNEEVLEPNGDPYDTGFLYGKQPVVIAFLEGHACAGCVDALAQLGARAAEFRAAGAQLVAITADNPAGAKQTVAQLQAKGIDGVRVFADPQRYVARQFVVKTPHAPTGLSAVFIVDTSGAVQLAARAETAGAVLPGPQELLASLKPTPP
ncbi:MAG TPA: redoxin domain-containing protein [bacterium]|nr:redoxin domain-containing protein [bacterium]